MVSSPTKWVFFPAALTFTFLCLSTAEAQPLCQLPFEAYLTDLDDRPIEGPVEIALNFYTADTVDDWVAARVFSLTEEDVDNGWIRLNIDLCEECLEESCGLNALDVYFASAIENETTPFLGVQIGTTQELSPRIPISSVPFALVAGDSESLGGIDADDYVTAENVASNLTAGDIEDLVGTHTATLPFSSITGTASRAQIPESGDADTLDSHDGDDFIQSDGTVALEGDWDVAGHRLVNLDIVVGASGTEPEGAVEGQLWWDTMADSLHIHDGTGFVALDSVLEEAALRALGVFVETDRPAEIEADSDATPVLNLTYTGTGGENDLFVIEDAEGAVFEVDGQGQVTADSYVGNGAELTDLDLTGVMLADGTVPFEADVNFSGYQLFNAILHGSDTAPEELSSGQLWWNTEVSSLNIWDGEEWLELEDSLTADDIVALVGAHTTELPFTSINGTASLDQLPEGIDADILDGMDSTDFEAAGVIDDHLVDTENVHLSTDEYGEFEDLTGGVETTLHTHPGTGSYGEWMSLLLLNSEILSGDSVELFDYADVSSISENLEYDYVYSLFSSDSATDTQNMVHVETGDYLCTAGVTYYVDIFASSISSLEDFEVNDCDMSQIEPGHWRLLSNQADYETNRAQVLKTLFYGVDTTPPNHQPRVDLITGLTALRTSDLNDVGRRAHLAWATCDTDEGDSTILDGTFLNVADNTSCSSWSDLSSNHSSSGWYLPLSTQRNQNGNELGVDTSSDELDNPVDCRLRAATAGGYSRGYALILAVGDISWSETQGGAGGISGSVDFSNEGVPVFTLTEEPIAADCSVTSQVWNVALTVEEVIILTNTEISETTNLQVEASADGGADWTTVEQGIPTLINTPGNQLQVRVSVNRSMDRINSVAILYR